MPSLTPRQQELFQTLVQAMDVVEGSSIPELAVAVHLGEDAAVIAPRALGVGGATRAAVRVLTSSNPEGFMQAVKERGGTFEARINAILRQTEEGAREAVGDAA